MKRVNAIWSHPEYQQQLRELTDCERERQFCRHTPEHFLDVARLTCLLAQEAGVLFAKELVYAAALLHDIGRALQYKEGVPHEEAGIRIAQQLLPDCGFEPEECAQVLDLIRSHRTGQEGTELGTLFCRADKLSRNCFCCPVQADCNWPKEKKNMEIRY